MLRLTPRVLRLTPRVLRLTLIVLAVLATVSVRAHDLERTRVLLTFARDGSFVLDVSNDPAWLKLRLESIRGPFIDRIVLFVDGHEVRPTSVELLPAPVGGVASDVPLATYRMRGRVPAGAHMLRWYYGLVIDPYPLTVRRADGRILVEEVVGDAWSREIDLNGQFLPLARWPIVVVVGLLAAGIALRLRGSRSAPSAVGAAPSAVGAAPSAVGAAPSAVGAAPSAVGAAPSARAVAPSSSAVALSALGVALLAAPLAWNVEAVQDAASKKVEIVSVTGCLREATPGNWTLTNATDPVPSSSNAPQPKEIPPVPPSGKGEFSLIGVSEFNLPAHKGHTVIVKGLHIRPPGQTRVSRLNITSVTTISASCVAGAEKQDK
jgi:hypothetical protein